MSGKHMKITSIVLAMLLLVVFAGCGGNDQPNTDNAANQQNSEQSKVVNIMYVAIPMAPPQPLVGIEEKIFEKTLAENGFKVKWVHSRSLDNVWPIMDKGEVDFAYIPTNNFATYITETSQFGGSDKYRAIAGSLNHNMWLLMVKPDIKTLKDLDGKTVGIVNHFYWEEMMLNKHFADVGLKTKALGGTVNVEYIDIMATFIDKFAKGDYAAITSWTETQGQVMKKAPNARVMTNLNAGKFGPNSPMNWLVAKKDVIDNNPELVKIMLKAHLQATDRATARQSDLASLAAKYYNYYFTDEIKAKNYPKFPLEYFTSQWADCEATNDPNLKFMKEVFDFLIEAGYLKDKTMDNFVDLKLLNEVLQEQGKPPIQG